VGWTERRTVEPGSFQQSNDGTRLLCALAEMEGDDAPGGFPGRTHDDDHDEGPLCREAEPERARRNEDDFAR
jgi:hypothetical protein